MWTALLGDFDILFFVSFICVEVFFARPFSVKSALRTLFCKGVLNGDLIVVLLEDIIYNLMFFDF